MCNLFYCSSTTVIEELVKFIADQLKKQNCEEDVILYIFLVRCANVLVARKRRLETKELARKIFELEQKIGGADTVEYAIFDTFLRERERYYVSFAIDTLDYQK